MKISVLFIGLIIITSSCQSSFEPAISNIPYGTWIYSSSHDSVHVYYSAKKFEKDKPGFAIKKDSLFIERTYGWCATPPLHYFNIEGKWKYVEENKIEIISGNWSNEDYSRIMKIISFSGHILKVTIYY